MKYNPKANEVAAAQPGWKGAHPLVADERNQGAIELIWRLQESLKAIGGFSAVSLQPAAGAHGELAGVFMIRAYHLAHGQAEPSQDAHPRQRPRHQPGVVHDGGPRSR